MRTRETLTEQLKTDLDSEIKKAAETNEAVRLCLVDGIQTINAPEPVFLTDACHQIFNKERKNSLHSLELEINKIVFQNLDTSISDKLEAQVTHLIGVAESLQEKRILITQQFELVKNTLEKILEKYSDEDTDKNYRKKNDAKRKNKIDLIRPELDDELSKLNLTEKSVIGSYLHILTEIAMTGRPEIKNKLMEHFLQQLINIATLQDISGLDEKSILQTQHVMNTLLSVSRGKIKIDISPDIEEKKQEHSSGFSRIRGLLSPSSDSSTEHFFRRSPERSPSPANTAGSEKKPPPSGKKS